MGVRERMYFCCSSNMADTRLVCASYSSKLRILNNFMIGFPYLEFQLLAMLQLSAYQS